MGEGRTMQDDSMDGIGRVESGTETEQLSRATQDAVAEARSNLLKLAVLFGRLPRCDRLYILQRHGPLARNDEVIRGFLRKGYQYSQVTEQTQGPSQFDAALPGLLQYAKHRCGSVAWA